METTSITYNDTNTNSEENQYCAYCGTVLWMSINICTASVALLGNVLTISAILLSKKLSSLISNHFVFSLAVSDLLVSLSIPYHMLFYIRTNLGDTETNCLLRFVLIAFACGSSICNILFIATDRYVAIVYPLHYNRFMTKKTALILITIGWLISFSMAAVPIVWNEWHEGIQCEVVNVLPYNYLNFIVCPVFVLIWIMMFLLYTRICREASGHEKRIRSTMSVQHTLTIKDSKSFQVMKRQTIY
ncbi:hypothetical protein NQ314_010762 [Rhamnusium bicolor]|uniref:G-protein coupled receptors family 1 profile domain-containing protein n=1 Tax=Rhamnusium bicolor TaxID=1586634 RepID=A0AAV8XQF9_9CUCU|nr:hypothetical protein NQ314_010762 [Rhamnusium bicolor]